MTRQEGRVFESSKKGLIRVSDDLKHSRCACVRVKTVSITSNERYHRVRTIVADFNDNLKWNFVTEMTHNTPSPQ